MFCSGLSQTWQVDPQNICLYSQGSSTSEKGKIYKTTREALEGDGFLGQLAAQPSMAEVTSYLQPISSFRRIREDFVPQTHNWQHSLEAQEHLPHNSHHTVFLIDFPLNSTLSWLILAKDWWILTPSLTSLGLEKVMFSTLLGDKDRRTTVSWDDRSQRKGIASKNSLLTQRSFWKW